MSRRNIMHNKRFMSISRHKPLSLDKCRIFLRTPVDFSVKSRYSRTDLRKVGRHVIAGFYRSKPVKPASQPDLKAI